MQLVANRTRTAHRSGAQLSSIFPGLERVLDLTGTGSLTWLIGYQTLAAIRRIDRRLETSLHNRHAVRTDPLAGITVQATERQQTGLLGEKLTVQLVHATTKDVMALNQQVTEDKVIEARSGDHQIFEAIIAMPGLVAIVVAGVPDCHRRAI